MDAFSPQKAVLTERFAYLRTLLTRIEQDLDAPVNPDWEEQATEREGDEVLETLGQSGQQEMRSIAAALDRMAAGTYGTCTKCGEAIAASRLTALPATPFCALCAPQTKDK